MLASIIIPCHNRLILLERAIKSVLRAVGSEHVEIIIIDDGSTPPLKTELLRHQDLVLRNETSIGAAKSRNLGIEKAKGKNIYLLDSDDFFLEINFYIENSKFTRATVHSVINITNIIVKLTAKVTLQTIQDILKELIFISIFFTKTSTSPKHLPLHSLRSKNITSTKRSQSIKTGISHILLLKRISQY